MQWLERRQVSIYLLASAAGLATGAAAPAVGQCARPIVLPLLALLLYLTFLTVPLARPAAALPPARFVLTVLAVDFLAAPALAWVLTRPLTGDAPLLAGAALVLLAPCIDYVVVFTGLAGGDAARLAALTPVLLLAQAVLLPTLVPLLAGSALRGAIHPEPLAAAAFWVLVLPLAAAALTQVLGARRDRVRRATELTGPAMVPVTAVTLAVVAAGHVGVLGVDLGRLAPLLPIYSGFAVVMLGLGVGAARLARLEPAAGRAVTFSGVTRNSLVVLPLALTLPAGWGLAAAAVLTQTIVELVVMVAMVWAVPRLLPAPAGRGR